jgi:hypothetical protein
MKWLLSLILALLAVGTSQSVGGQALAQEPASLRYVSGSAGSSDVNARALRAGLAMSAIGVALSTAGLAVGARNMLYNRCDLDCLTEQDRRQRIGIIVISVSAVALGTSIFGIIRTRRKLREVSPKTVRDREPASWR